jgi:hypothetical protein
MPGITLFIFSARIPPALIALAWSIAGIIAVWWRSRTEIWIVNLGLLFFVALIGATVVALFCPMIPMVAGGMSDASLASPASSH